MKDTKSFLTSKTLWGLILSGAAMLFDFTYTEADVGSTVDIATKVVELVGLVVAAYGRFTATTTISGVK